MKPKTKLALLFLGFSIGGTAILSLFAVLTLLLTDDPITLRVFLYIYLALGAPFTAAAIYVYVLPEWFVNNEKYAIAAGFVSVWGVFFVKMGIPNLEIFWCAIISVVLAMFIAHYLRLRAKARGNEDGHNT